MKTQYWLLLVGLVCFVSWRTYRYQQVKRSLPDREAIIGQALDERVQAFKDKLEQKCHKDAIEEAKEIADSIAFVKAEALMLFDTLSRPEKPTRPIKPARLPLRDSLEVKPLLDSL